MATSDLSDTNAEADGTDTNDSDVVMTNGKEATNGAATALTAQPEVSSNEETMDVDPAPVARDRFYETGF
jgi:hypothetical protein